MPVKKPFSQPGIAGSLVLINDRLDLIKAQTFSCWTSIQRTNVVPQNVLAQIEQNVLCLLQETRLISSTVKQRKDDVSNEAETSSENNSDSCAETACAPLREPLVLPDNLEEHVWEGYADETCPDTLVSTTPHSRLVTPSPLEKVLYLEQNKVNVSNSSTSFC